MARITVDERSPTPIYAQIIDKVRRAIASGELRPGDQLPTVRQLAVDLRVNANTVARAYMDLERLGVIETRRGKGTFVAERKTEDLDAARADALKAIARTAVSEAAALGFGVEMLIRAVINETEQRRVHRSDRRE